MNRLLTSCLAALALLLTALPAARAQPAPAGSPSLDAVVTVPPLKGIVEPLLPVGSRVTVLMKPGRSEHGYEMTAQDIVRVARADLFVYVGAGLESRVERVLDKRGQSAGGVVCFATAVGEEKAQEVQGHECTQHEGHDHEGHDHDAHAADQHLWLDPMLVKELIPALALEIETRLRARAAWNDEEAAALAARREALLNRIDDLDAQYRSRLADAAASGSKAIITHHDAFSRPAKRYGLTVAAVIRVAGAGESSPGDLARVLSAAKESNAKAIFREPQFDPKAAERLAKRAGLKVLVLDPLGDGDWFAMMQRNLDALCEGLTGEPKETTERNSK